MSARRTAVVHRELKVASSDEALAEDLAGRILYGELTPGEPVRELQLVDEYGVGRYTARAALRRLVHDGLVRHEPNRGATVSRFTSADIEEIFWLRSILEEGVGRVLTERHIRPEAAERELARFQSLPDTASWSTAVDIDMSLHLALVEAVGSSRLDRIYRSISTEMRFGIAQLKPFYESPRILADEHRLILDAIASGDAETAVAVIRDHLWRAVTDITHDTTRESA